MAQNPHFRDKGSIAITEERESHSLSNPNISPVICVFSLDHLKFMTTTFHYIHNLPPQYMKLKGDEKELCVTETFLKSYTRTARENTFKPYQKCKF